MAVYIDLRLLPREVHLLSRACRVYRARLEKHPAANPCVVESLGELIGFLDAAKNKPTEVIPDPPEELTEEHKEEKYFA
jgi:hypothetical protein